MDRKARIKKDNQIIGSVGHYYMYTHFDDVSVAVTSTCFSRNKKNAG